MRSLRKVILSAALAGSLGLVSPAFAATIDITATADGDVFVLNGNALTAATGGNVNISQNVVPGVAGRLRVRPANVHRNDRVGHLPSVGRSEFLGAG
jgi:hypothetical protein